MTESYVDEWVLDSSDQADSDGKLFGVKVRDKKLKFHDNRLPFFLN